MIWEEKGNLKDEEGKEVAPRTERSLEEKFRRHNQELKKIRKFIRRKPDKGKFETVYLKEFDRPSASYEPSFYEFKTERMRKRKS